MPLRATDLYSCSDSEKTKNSEKRKTIMQERRENKRNTVTKRNAICAMASCLDLPKLDFLDNTIMYRLLRKIKSSILFQVRASITVEASLIAAAIMMAVFLCVYYGFILHDKAVLEEISWHTAQKAMFFVTENSSMEEGSFDWEALQKKGLLWRLAKNTADEGAICDYANRCLSGELFACDIPELSIASDAGNIQITYRANIRLPIFSLMHLWGVPSEVTGQVQVYESKQEEFIRLVRAIMQDNEKKQ